MATATPATYGDLSDEQLIHSVLRKERELVRARFRHSTNQLENTAELKVLRREVARLLTEARRREVAQGLGKDALLAGHRGSFRTEGEESAEAAPEKGGFLSGIVDKLTGKE